MFNNKLELIMQYEIVPEMICLTRNALVMINKPDTDEQEITTANINRDYISGNDVPSSIVDKVDFGLRASYSFGRDLIKGMIEKKRFEKFRPPA